jgi:hypothetical protein
MTDITRPFGRAVQATLQSALPAGTDVFYGKVTKPDHELTFPYVVVWLIPATLRRANLTGTMASPDSRLQLTGVGRDLDEVATVLDRCAAALHGHRPILDGWRCGLIWQIPADQAITKNEDLWTPEGTPTYRGVALFRLSSEPAPVPAES